MQRYETHIPNSYRDYGEPRTAIPWPSPVSRTAGANFKALSWNVGGMRTFLKDRSSQLLDVLKQESPDVLAFMESKLQEMHEFEMQERLEELGVLKTYDVYWNSCTNAEKKGYSGTCVGAVGEVVFISLWKFYCGNGMGRCLGGELFFLHFLRVGVIKAVIVKML